MTRPKESVTFFFTQRAKTPKSVGMDHIFSDFDKARIRAGDATAAAILVLASEIKNAASNDRIERLSHELCLGLRAALYGTQAEHQSNLLDINNELADAIVELGEALKKSKKA